MKNKLIVFFAIFLNGVLLSSCNNQVLPITATSTLTPKALVSLTTTRTASPTFTPFPPFPSATLPPLPRDVFDNFWEVSGYCKVKTVFGNVSTDNIIDETVLSDTTIGWMRFFLSWRTGDLDLSLIQPDGTLIDSFKAEAVTDPFILQFDSTPNTEEYSLSAPQPGPWTVRIFGKSTPTSGTPYMLEVWASDATIISIDFDKNEYFPSDPIKLTASIEDSISASPLSPEYIYGVVIKGIVEDPKRQQYPFELFDDGLHGDGKSNDGVYSGTVDSTSLSGNYKFYFQISGLNNRANEPFTRECFLGKTIDPIPTPTPTLSAENLACNGPIQASDPVVVRAENEGGNDSSDYSRYSFYPKAVSTSAGILVTWRMGFEGMAPQPNAYMRLLDANTSPITDVKLLFDRNWVGLDYSLVGTEYGAVLAYCGRHSAEDKITSAILDPDGNLIAEQVQSSACPPLGAESIWTGSRLMFAWTDQFYGPNGRNNDVVLDVADANGNSLFKETLHKDGEGKPHFALGHDRVLMVVGVRSGMDLSQGNRGQSRLAVHRFDLDGNELGAPFLLEPVPYDNEGLTNLGEFGSAFIVPTSEGWMVLASSKASGYYVAFLNRDGMLASGPFIMETSMDFHNGFDDVIPYGGGAAVLGDGRLLLISSDGIVRQEWHPNSSEPLGNGSFVVHNGHLFVTYTTTTSGKRPTNQVLIREFQCAP